jgi:prepilin-type N-terminal cleavage/methylation domain-containing protein
MMEKKPASRIVRRGPQAGFTLIEILMAMTIFSTSFLALAAGASTVMKSNHTSYNSTVATTLAQDKLEELLAKTGTDINAGGPIADTVGSVVFTRTWTIDNAFVAGVRRVNVVVTWNDRTDHTLTVSTAVVL